MAGTRETIRYANAVCFHSFAYLVKNRSKALAKARRSPWLKGAGPPVEWEQVRAHARYTEEILSRLSPFAELALVAGAHHERLDGKGYPKGLLAEAISKETRIITLADIFDAITAERPYRGAIPVPQALQMMEKTRAQALDGDCLDALYACLPRLVATVGKA